jgi:beta-1,4-mannosyl-glycoprotein beta-1,4-N-acetylglucosaminyltransferase
MKPRRFDCFPFAGTPTELLLLECRLTELYDVMDAFVIVEADVDHQNHPKPYQFLKHASRYDAWADKIVYVPATGLPDTPHISDPWAREHAQREWIAAGLEDLDAQDDDIVFQSDADEIPNILAARNVKPPGKEMVSLAQRGHFWAVDWQYPQPWHGTVVARWGGIKTLADRRSCGPFAAMRDSRNANKKIPGGWHLSWLTTSEGDWIRKVNSFCHPEVEDRIRENADKYFQSGIHVDGQVMLPVDVNHSWPKWIQDPKNVPATWYRPR